MADDKKEIPIENAEVHETAGGKKVRGDVQMVDIKDLTPMIKPKQPWPTGEVSFRMFVESGKSGHRQLLVKCMVCSLEFALFSWRTELELVEHFKPSLGIEGGLCDNITCPECGDKKTLWIGVGQSPGTITNKVANMRDEE